MKFVGRLSWLLVVIHHHMQDKKHFLQRGPEMIVGSADDDIMDTRQDEGATGVSSAGTSASPSTRNSFRILATDARGNLIESDLPASTSSLTADAPSNGHIDLRDTHLCAKARGSGASRGDLAVQRMVCGPLWSRKNVTALARRNGTIDLVDCSSSKGHLILTLDNAEMKPGMHRWVGLALAPDGVFACTSAGNLRFYALLETDGGNLVLDEGRTRKRELSEPIQHLVFSPASDPAVFAYGGEEIPLSVWNVRKAISQPDDLSSHSSEGGKENGAAQSEADQNGDSTSPLSNKQKKRKRIAESRAKSAELQHGEIWRAKNLPNDALSLPQRAEILCITAIDKSKWAVGTKSGLVRIFDIEQQRKHTREFRVFDHDKAPVKHLALSHAGTELIAADTLGRVFVVDWRSGSTLYQYKDIHGAVSALQVLPPAAAKRPLGVSYFVSASADRMLRLHSVPQPTEDEAKDDSRKMTKRKGAIIAAVFSRDGVTNVAWNGQVPQLEDEHVVSSNGHNRDRKAADQGTGDDHDDDDDDEIWDEMATVEQQKTKYANGDDDLDDASARELRAKRRR